MSQIFLGTSDSNSPSDVLTSITVDQSATLGAASVGAGNVIPQGGNIRLAGDNGIVSVKDPAQPGLTALAFTSGATQTVGVQTKTIIPFTLLTDSVLTIQVIVSGRDAGNGDGIGGYCTATVKNEAGAASIVGGTVPDVLVSKDTSLATGTFTVGVTGAQFIVTVTGVAGRTINWDACLPGIIQSD